MPPSGNSPFLQQLRRLKPSSPDFHVQLNGVFCEQEYARCVLNLQGDDLAWLVGYLDKARRHVSIPYSLSAKTRVGS